MGQKYLNNIAILHIHQDILNNVVNDQRLNEFISRNDLRRKTFISVKNIKIYDISYKLFYFYFK